METTNLKIGTLKYEAVVITAGMRTSDGRRIYGVFACESDARSDGADSSAIAVVGEDRLTQEQREAAERNGEAL